MRVAAYLLLVLLLGCQPQVMMVDTSGRVVEDVWQVKGSMVSTDGLLVDMVYVHAVKIHGEYTEDAIYLNTYTGEYWIRSYQGHWANLAAVRDDRIPLDHEDKPKEAKR